MMGWEGGFGREGNALEEEILSQSQMSMGNGHFVIFDKFREPLVIFDYKNSRRSRTRLESGEGVVAPGDEINH